MKNFRISKDLEASKAMLNTIAFGKRGVLTKDQDRVIVITGKPGRGKSNLFLWLHLYWNKQILKQEVTLDNLYQIATTNDQFFEALAKVNAGDMYGHDEAVLLLYAGDSSKKATKGTVQTFNVIRGKNLVSVLLIPNIMRMTPYFRQDRVDVLMHVYDIGKVAVYSRDRLDSLLPALKRMADKNSDPDPLQALDLDKRQIQASFYDTFPEYKKILKEEYLKKKEANIQEQLSKEQTNKETKLDAANRKEKEAKKAAELYKKHKSFNKVGQMMGLSDMTVKRRLMLYCPEVL